MNQSELIAAVADQTPEIPRGEVELVVKNTINELFETLGKHEEVMFGRVGKFEVQQQDARTGRNPATGETIDIPAKGRVKFKPSKPLRDAVA